MEKVTIDSCTEKLSSHVEEISRIEQEYTDYICNIYCPYFIKHRHNLIRQEGSIATFEKDKQIAEMEVNLIKRMGYIPKSVKLFQEPPMPKSPTDSLTVHKINRVDEVMKLYLEGTAKYNTLK